MSLVSTVRIFLLALVLGTLAAATGCASAGVAVRESLGIPKREQLVDRVKDARDSQDTAKKQFESALDEFLIVTGQKGKMGDMEAQYNKFKSERERCESRLPPYMRPGKIVHLETLPQNANGKVDRKAVRALMENAR